MKKYIFIIALLAISILSVFTDWYSGLSISLGVVLLAMLIDKMGDGIILRESIAFMYVFTCVLMPLLGYKFYGIGNALSKLWVRYMPLSESGYFSFALPAVSFFCLGIMLPFSFKRDLDEGANMSDLVSRIKAILQVHKKTGLVIIVVGSLVSFSVRFMPAGLQFFANLFFFSSFAALLYIYFSPNFRYKRWVMGLFTVFTVYNAINGGMFTILAYMGITIFSFLLLGLKTSLFRKIVIFLLASTFFIVLQNVKLTYRNYIWHSRYTGNKASLFTGIFWDNILKGSELIGQDAFFPIYMRTNQGYNVAMVMRRIPVRQPHDGGERLAKVFASAFVPRFLWPNKPEAGGKFNMKYYAGMDIRGWSTNVGPLGEAYGSFGVIGGVVYMCFLGLFLRWAYFRVFVIAGRIPLLVCWVPVLFYQVTSSSETDTLQIMNSMVKAAFFVWLLVKLLPDWFAIVRIHVEKARKVKRSLA